MSQDAPHIMILTGEPSGDFHAGPLVHHLRALAPRARFSGIGGSAMAAQKVALFFDIDRLSAMGLIQVARQFSDIKQAFSAFRQKLRSDPPDLVIFIDYPGFNLKAAAYVKSRTKIPTLYYIAPKVWAWNSSRLNKIKLCMDHVALILPFELPIYKKRAIPATYVGNPLVDEYPLQALSTREMSDTSGLKIGLLPGSRISEVKGLLPGMLDAAARLAAKRPDIRFYISAASTARKIQILEILDRHPVNHLCRVIEDRPVNIFRQVAMVIAASGTVTLEAALCRVPTILIYKVSPLTYALGKLLVKVKYAGLANLIAGTHVMPELIQDEASPEKIYLASEQMLGSLERHRQNLAQVRLRLGLPGAARRTAGIALDLIRNQWG